MVFLIVTSVYSVLLFFTLSFPVMALSDNGIIRSAQSVKSEIDNCAEKNLTQAYKNIGYQVQFPYFNASRSLIEANLGRADAETARIAGIEKDYPNLIRIPVEICRLKIELYATSALKLDDIKALQHYRIGYRAGNITLKRMLNYYSPKLVTTYEQLLQMLLSDRLDIIIMHASTGRLFKNEHNLHRVDLTLPQVPLYHYVHKKHAALIPKLTKSLQALEKSGFTEATIVAHQEKMFGLSH